MTLKSSERGTAQAGWIYALLGVTLFALTLPMTRLAVGSPQDPALSGVFVASGRGAVAALLSLLYLRWTRAPWPSARDWRQLAGVAAGVVLGFPFLTSWAMRQVEAVHASVMLGILPLTTAALGALLQRQRPTWRFWAWASLGSALVVGYALLAHGGRLHLAPADLALLAAMGCAATGYAVGSRLSHRLRPDHVICWALLLCLPLTAPLTLLSWPDHPVATPAWLGFVYVAVGSQWLGFFAWYRGLALGGTVRMSQLQLLQPFLSMLSAVALLGESLDASSILCGLAVAGVVAASRRAPIIALTPTDSPKS